MQLPKRKPGTYSQTPFDPLMSQNAFDAMQEDLKRLKTKKPQAAAEVNRLAQLGDFSENVEYQLAKGRLRSINNRILKLENQLNQAVVIQPKNSGVVEIGTTVTVHTDGKKYTYTLLGSSETDPSKGIISHLSPIGSALLGKKVGDMVEIIIGKKVTIYTIQAIV